jgi:hypothetical protein
MELNDDKILKNALHCFKTLILHLRNSIDTNCVDVRSMLLKQFYKF